MTDTEIKELLSKINNPAAKLVKKEAVGKKPPAPKLDEDGNPIEPKKRTLKSEPSSKTNLKKAEGQTLDKFFKKKNKNSSDEEDDDDIESICNTESVASTSFSPPAEKRVIARERKPGKKNLYLGLLT